MVIAGAGMVGSTLALILGQSGFSVALVERGGRPGDWDGRHYDRRVSAVNLGSERLLQRVDAWTTISNRRVCSYRHMFVWDAGSTAKIEFDCADLGVPHLGSIVENSLVLWSLHQRLASAPDVVIVNEVEPVAITSNDAGVTVELSSGDRLRAKLLVGADGAGSRVRTLLGVASRSRAFDQDAIVAQVGTEKPHRHTAWQRFLPSGPLAFLPLSNGDCSIVWSCRRALAEELMGLEDEAFRRRLTEAFASRLGEVSAVGPRGTFPLLSAHADRYAHQRSVLIGDAAHVVHPLAGQGANLGMADAAALAEVLVNARARGRDIGGRPALRRYERWRKGDNLAMVGAMRGFNALFGSQDKVLSRVREIGLRATDSAGPVKRLFARYAMGLGGDLPVMMGGRGYG